MGWQWSTIIETDAYAGDRGEYSYHEWSVTEASDGEILDACDAIAPLPNGAVYSVTRDFDGRAYVSVNGEDTYQLESIETCDACGGDLDDGGDGYDGLCATCADMADAAAVA